MLVENLLHVPIGLLDLDLDACSGVIGHGLLRQLSQKRFLFLQPVSDEITNQHAHRRTLDSGFHDVGMNVAFVALRRFGGQRVRAATG